VATKSYGCAHLWSGYAGARYAEAFRSVSTGGWTP